MDPAILSQIAQQSGAPAPMAPKPPAPSEPTNPLEGENKMILEALIKRLEFNGKVMERGATLPMDPMAQQVPPQDPGMPPQM